MVHNNFNFLSPSPRMIEILLPGLAPDNLCNLATELACPAWTSAPYKRIVVFRNPF